LNSSRNVILVKLGRGVITDKESVPMIDRLAGGKNIWKRNLSSWRQLVKQTRSFSLTHKNVRMLNKLVLDAPSLQDTCNIDASAS